MRPSAAKQIMLVGVLMCACVGPVVASGVCPVSRPFTLDADFDEGTMDKVNHTTVHDPSIHPRRGLR
jgi:hypothetical protein